jgi:hypothetical protein
VWAPLYVILYAAGEHYSMHCQYHPQQGPRLCILKVNGAIEPKDQFKIHQRSVISISEKNQKDKKSSSISWQMLIR